jgi:hypothetical protein
VIKTTGIPDNDLVRDILTLKRQVAALERNARGSEWYDYTPVWTALTTPPVLGNGTLTGRYARVGPIVQCKIAWAAGATTTFGVGTWLFSIPFPYSGTGITIGSALGRTAGARYPGHAVLDQALSTEGMSAYISNATSSLIRQDQPFVWVSGNDIHLSVTYETDS